LTQETGKLDANFTNQEKKMNKLLNWSELSRYITKGDRNGIRFNKIPKKHIEALDQLFSKELPKWWEEQKSKLADKPEAGGKKNNKITPTELD
jgi:hypothetical protein